MAFYEFCKCMKYESYSEIVKADSAQEALEKASRLDWDDILWDAQIEYIEVRKGKTEEECENSDWDVLENNYDEAEEEEISSEETSTVGDAEDIQRLSAAINGEAEIPTSPDNEIVVNVDDLQITMIQVEGGTFTMGATSEQESDAEYNEKPTHQVTLDTYYIGRYEVTQALWRAVMGSNPSNKKGDNLPVDMVSWDDCQDFIKKLNAKTGRYFRLPTEAEWEYAARGGNKTRGYIYSGSNDIDEVAWYYDNSDNEIHDVGTKQPNELGLYDMTGNVDEWCQDWYGSYSSSSQKNPTGASSGSYRVNRGGGYDSFDAHCRSSYRGLMSPDDRFDGLGLRLVLSE